MQAPAHTTLRETIALTQAAGKRGVDGIMLVTPSLQPSQSGRLVSAFQDSRRELCAADHAAMCPGRTGVNLLPETVARLAEIDNIVAIKEASGNLNQVSKLRSFGTR